MRYRLRDALQLCPMDQCLYRHGTVSRSWWRYGWAHGFVESNRADILAPITSRRYRDAVEVGFARGRRARAELDAGEVSA